MIWYSHEPLYSYRQFSEEELRPLWEEVNQIRTKMEYGLSELSDARPTLAGNISKEYHMSQNSMEYTQHLLNPIFEEFTDDKNIHTGQNWRDSAIRIKSQWVNFSKKHEFNPVHDHNGLLSFVIWMNIPYDVEDELNLETVKHSNLPLAGHFSFYYTNPFGKIVSRVIPVDRKMNGTAALFPSQLSHEVYPFYTSDDYRITISGNYHYDN